MQIAKDKVVAIDYTLKDDEGNVLDSSGGGSPLAYLHGASNIIPGLESALEGKVAGDDISVRIAPDQAYGEHDPEKQQAVPKEMFGDAEITVGAQYHASGPNGEHITVTVVAMDDDQVTVDANHPLAGVFLNFDVTVVEVRDATDEEISHGHAHGPGHSH